MGVKVGRLCEAEGKEDTKETSPLNHHEQSSHGLTETKAARPGTSGSALSLQCSSIFYISIFFLVVCFLWFSLLDLKSHLEEFLPNLKLLTRWMPAPPPRIFKTNVHILIFYQDKTGPLSSLWSTSAYFPQTSHYMWKFINVTLKYTILF